MGKKCIRGIICIENTALFILFCTLVILGYILYTQYKVTSKSTDSIYLLPSNNLIQNMPFGSSTRILHNDTMRDVYAPPAKNDGYNNTKIIDERGGIPVNIETRSTGTDYGQVGILTRLNNVGKEAILPLMGRKSMVGRDKWQYYTMTNTGNLNTKLPVSTSGKSCTGEYGCQELYNGDNVYVEGYNDTFKATLYENSMFNYIPYL